MVRTDGAVCYGFKRMDHRPTHMSNGYVTYGVPVLGVIAGLAILLYSEYTHSSEMITYSGGLVIVLAVGLLTAAIAQD